MKAVIGMVLLGMVSGVAVNARAAEDQTANAFAGMATQFNKLWAHGNTYYRIQACVKAFGPVNCDDSGFVDPQRFGENTSNLIDTFKQLRDDRLKQ